MYKHIEHTLKNEIILKCIQNGSGFWKCLVLEEPDIFLENLKFQEIFQEDVFEWGKDDRQVILYAMDQREQSPHTFRIICKLHNNVFFQKLYGDDHSLGRQQAGHT